MEHKEDVCPYCGGTELVKGKQNGQGMILPYRRISMFSAQKLVHLVCKNCGTVVRSYIENPQDFK